MAVSGKAGYGAHKQKENLRAAECCAAAVAQECACIMQHSRTLLRRAAHAMAQGALRAHSQAPFADDDAGPDDDAAPDDDVGPDDDAGPESDDASDDDVGPDDDAGPDDDRAN